MLAIFPEGAQPAREDIRAVLDALTSEYTARGVELRQIGSGWRIQTREKYAEYVARLLEERPQRYTRALLETLAIIAYRQPVTRGEIEHIRGVSVSTDIIRTLTERGWIKEVGRRDVPGRPALLGTTREFLEHFNLRNLEDMPPLAELRSLEEVGAELERRELPAGAPDSAGSATAPGDVQEAQVPREAGMPGAAVALPLPSRDGVMPREGPGWPGAASVPGVVGNRPPMPFYYPLSPSVERRNLRRD